MKRSKGNVLEPSDEQIQRARDAQALEALRRDAVELVRCLSRLAERLDNHTVVKSDAAMLRQEIKRLLRHIPSDMLLDAPKMVYIDSGVTFPNKPIKTR